MYKAIIFDIDGVLNNAIRFSTRYSQHYNIDISTMLPFFDGPFQKCLIGKADLKIELNQVLKDWKFPGTVDDLLRFWLEGEVNPNPVVIESIKHIRDAGYTTVGATNQEKYRTAYLVDTLKLNTFFDHTYSSATIGKKKPDPAFYHYILTDLQLKPNEVLYWDDDEENVTNASNLGINAYLFTCNEKFQLELENELHINLL